MPYGITQCYLPPGRGDIPAFTPAKLVLVLATPEGSKAESTATSEHNLNVTLIVIDRSEPLRSCHAFFTMTMRYQLS